MRNHGGYRECSRVVRGRASASARLLPIPTRTLTLTLARTRIPPIAILAIIAIAIAILAAQPPTRTRHSGHQEEAPRIDGTRLRTTPRRFL